MMHKNFDTKTSERPTFTISGQDFTARAKLSFRDLIRLADFQAKFGKMFTDETADGEQILKFFTDFFDMVLVRADRSRFSRLLLEDTDEQGEESDDEDDMAGAEAVGEVMAWLMDYYLPDEVVEGKVPGQSPPISDTPETTGPTSKVVSFSRGTVELTPFQQAQ